MVAVMGVNMGRYREVPQCYNGTIFVIAQPQASTAPLKSPKVVDLSLFLRYVPGFEYVHMYTHTGRDAHIIAHISNSSSNQSKQQQQPPPLSFATPSATA